MKPHEIPAASYLVNDWAVTGGPAWASEPAIGDACARLTQKNRGDNPVKRIAVFVVPPEMANLGLDSLVRAARDGLLAKIFEDREQVQRLEAAR